MKTSGMFQDWDFNTHTAKKDGYSLWLSNGFMFFEDYVDQTRKPFLRGLSLLTRWRIWRELKRELRRRSLFAVSQMIQKSDVEFTKQSFTKRVKRALKDADSQSRSRPIGERKR